MNVTSGKRGITAQAGSAEMVWVASIVGFLVIAGVLFYFLPRTTVSTSGSASSSLAVGTPLHTLTFDDGSSLQIFNIGDGSVVDGDINPKPISSMFSSVSSGTSTSGMSGNGVKASLLTATISDQIVGLQFDSPPANLVIQTRLLWGQSPIACKHILWENEIRNDENRNDFPGWEAFLASPERDSSLPELVVQLSDGAGGWINGCGPYSSDEDREHRGMIAFPAWPRSGAELEFRAARPGLKPVTWKMKNPSHMASPATWTASPFPQKQTDSDYDLELKAAVKIEGSRLIQPKFVFLSKVPGVGPQPDDGSNGYPALRCDCVELLGAWGTRADSMFIKQPGNHVAYGFPHPPDENLLRFRFVISPTKNYPYPRTQALLIATAKVATNGTSFESKPQIITGNGVLSVEFRDVTTGNKGRFQYSIKGGWNNQTERKMGEAAIGNGNGSRIPICYVGGSDVKVGIVDTRGHSIGSNGKVTEFEFEGVWEGPLKPGDEITLGMTTPLPDREVFFTFEP